MQPCKLHPVAGGTGRHKGALLGCTTAPLRLRPSRRSSGEPSLAERRAGVAAGRAVHGPCTGRPLSVCAATEECSRPAPMNGESADPAALVWVWVAPARRLRRAGLGADGRTGCNQLRHHGGGDAVTVARPRVSALSPVGGR